MVLMLATGPKTRARCRLRMSCHTIRFWRPSATLEESQA